VSGQQRHRSGNGAAGGADQVGLLVERGSWWRATWGVGEKRVAAATFIGASAASPGARVLRAGSFCDAAARSSCSLELLAGQVSRVRLVGRRLGELLVSLVLAIGDLLPLGAGPGSPDGKYCATLRRIAFARPSIGRVHEEESQGVDEMTRRARAVGVVGAALLAAGLGPGAAAASPAWVGTAAVTCTAGGFGDGWR
jgi:hypothetical protein